MVRKFLYDADTSTLNAVDDCVQVRPRAALRGVRATLIFAAIAASILGFGIAASGHDPPASGTGNVASPAADASSADLTQPDAG